VGESGCGKSTLARMIIKLLPSDGGRIVFDGTDISGWSEAAMKPLRRRIQIVFQDPYGSLNPRMSVGRILGEGLRTIGVRGRENAAERTEKLLALVGLPGSEPKYPAQLSGGQQQRIALARALATKPGLLLLDEPLSALDAIVRVHLRQEIRALQRQLGVTTIMVTHDQEEALAVADRIVVMNHGVIEHVGTPLEVYRDPGTPFVADFVGRINVLPARLVEDQRVLFADTAFHCPHQGAPGSAVKIYLRPEDVLARPIAAGDSNVFDAQIEKIEFLGSYCLVQVRADALGEHRLSVYLSLNFLSEQQLEVGARLPLRLLPERMRIFT
jgi:iron(III) transport system ATP-binding protein